MAKSVIGNKELDIKYGSDYCNVNVADDNDYVTVESSKPINFEQGIMVGGQSVTNVSVTPTLTTGTQIATITIDGVDETLYAPSGSGGSGIENLVDGSSSDSLRQTSSAAEDASYTIGSGAFTEGNGTKAAGDYAHAEGSVTVASGEASHAEGSSTTASQVSSHAEGTSTTASNTSAHAEGNTTTASGVDSHAEGNTTTASGSASHAEGSQTISAGQWTHTEGRSTYANFQAAHAEGTSTIAVSTAAHAEGYATIATGGAGVHAEGQYTIAAGGAGAHVEGQGDQVSISFSTPVGQTSKRQFSGNYSRFFKIYGICNSYSPTTVVSFWKPEYNSSTDVTVFTGTGLPNDFPAEGTLTIFTQQASSQAAHSEGRDCLAIGINSHAEGKSTVASRKSNHVFGEYNIWDVVGNSSSDRGTYVEIVGNGTSETNRSNARTLDWSGNQVNAGTVTATDFVIPGASGTSLSTIAQSIINIPTKTSDLSNDSGFITKDVNDLTNYTLSSNLATVATSGSYTDLTNTPSIPAAQIQSDWSQSDNTAVDYIKNKPTIPDAVSVTQIETSGTNIASITIGNTTTQLYAPSGGSGGLQYLLDGSQWGSVRGIGTNATIGANSFAEGLSTKASGNYAHAEGIGTTASGNNGAHSEGNYTIASGDSSHAEGLFTTAQRKSQHVFGEYNVLDSAGLDTTVRGDYIEIVGNGTSDYTRSNARTLDWSGNEMIAGNLTLGGASGVKLRSGSNAVLETSSDGGSTWSPVGGGGTQIQSDWNQTNTSAVDYIKNKPTIPDAVSVTQIQSTGTNIASITIGNTTTQLYAPSGGGVTEAYVKGFVGNGSTTNSSATASQADDTFLVSTVSSNLTLTITATSDSVLSGRYIEYAGSVKSTNGGTLTFTMPSGVTTTWMDGRSGNSYTMTAGSTYAYSIIYCKTAAKAYATINEVGSVITSGIIMKTSSSSAPIIGKNTYTSLTSTSISTITLQADSGSTSVQEWAGVFTTGASQTSVTFAWSSGSNTINWSSSPSSLMSSTKYAFAINGGGAFPYVGTLVPLLY